MTWLHRISQVNVDSRIAVCANCGPVLVFKASNGTSWLCAKANNERRKRWIRTDPRLGLLIRAKQRARVDNIPFNLELNDIKIPERCPILGIPIECMFVRHPSAPSLDRIDPVIGYVRGNIRVVSYRGNRLRDNSTFEEQVKIVADSLRLRSATCSYWSHC